MGSVGVDLVWLLCGCMFSNAIMRGFIMCQLFFGFYGQDQGIWFGGLKVTVFLLYQNDSCCFSGILIRR